MSLYICRHGRTEANATGLLLGRADPDLDDAGQAQAKAIAAAVAAPAMVVSSPLARCRQTAEAFGLPVEIDDRLIELDYGDFDLKPLRDIPAEVWARWRSDSDFRPPGGETLNELGERVMATLDELAAPAADQDVVVVTHVSPIKASVAWALDCPMAVSWRCFVAQASITEIAVSANGPSLRLFNGVSHLETIDLDRSNDG
ncbi:MAG: histidine phosphatase family protein [Acidimicrobiales bacterium]